MKIKEKFEGLMAKIHPDGVSSEQKIDLERVFYAGYASLFYDLLDNESLSDEEAEAKLADIGAEIEVYFEGAKNSASS